MRKKFGKYDEVPRVSTEKLDPVPFKTTILLDGPTPIEVRLRNLIQSERLAEFARKSGVETWEESNDFDIPDDLHPPEIEHELLFDEGLGREVTRAEKKALDEERALYKREYLQRRKQLKRYIAQKQRVSAPPKGKPATPPANSPPEGE